MTRRSPVRHFCLQHTKTTKMFPQMLIVTLLSFASASEDLKNYKRSISNFGLPSWNTLLGTHYPWQASPFPQGSLYSLSSGYSGKGGHFGLEATATQEIAAAIAAAKEATAAAVLAHQRVQAARELVAIQERMAAAKEAAAEAAIKRSESAARIAAAIQKSEALAAAAAAAVHKSAAVSAASAAAAHAATHLPNGPWIHPKSVLNH